MNAQVFDGLTRRLTTGVPRRQTVALLAGALSAMLASDERKAGAACKKVGKNCAKNKDCCNGATCKNGKCKCKSDFDDCDGDGKCKRITNDDANCGACGNICPAGENCRDGACERCIPSASALGSQTHVCASDAECCGSGRCCAFEYGIGGFITTCFDLNSNSSFCGGSCENVVNCRDTGQVCIDGECVDDPAI